MRKYPDMVTRVFITGGKAIQMQNWGKEET